MDYTKVTKLGDWIFAISGCGLIWTSVYRFGFGESFSSMPRSVYIVACQLFVMGVLMILAGLNFFKLGELMTGLKLLWGKGLYCLFVAGYMDVVVYSFSNLVTLINLFILGAAGFFLVTGVIFTFQELRALLSYRK